MLQIKDEPIELDDMNSYFTTKPTHTLTIHNLEDILLNTFNDIEFNIHEKCFVNNQQQHLEKKFSVENVLEKVAASAPIVMAKVPNQKTKKQQHKPIVLKAQQQQQPHTDSHQQALNDNQLKEVYATLLHCDLDWLKIDEEEVILNKLNKLLDDQHASNHQNNELNFTYSKLRQNDLNRYRCKLNLRRLKRLKRLKCFDIDTYTNELIDSETNSNMQHLRLLDASLMSQKPPNSTNQKATGDNVIGSDEDIIALNHRVLDRFDSPKKRKLQNHYQLIEDLYMVSMVEYRNDDVKCVISPYTNKPLKPYIRRDYESWPQRLQLHQELHNKYSKQTSAFNCNPINYERHSIDYVYLRPEHVIPINNLCRKYFWNGIDISECLQYPDYTCVALYRKLIIGFACLVPNITLKEDYLSFIFVHPNWRLSNIAKYMMYRLGQINYNHDIILHVSVNSSAVLFYQKFGFKIEEYIKQFYDKYYSDEDSSFLSKDAFLMRLAR